MDKGWIFLIFSFFILIPFFVRAQDFDEFLMPSIPGRVEGKGKYFQIKDSDYLNISLESSEEISVILESIPKAISLNIIESSSNSTILTLKGLEPNKTYFKYQDSYKEGAVFVSDENGTISWQQDLTEPHYIWFQEEKGTIFLTRDCSNYGNWETSTQTCTLTEDVTTTIEIDANNVTLDCNGHQIQNEYWISGPILTHGIYAYQKRGVKIKNCNITGFDYSLFLNYSNENEVLKNNISKSYGGGILIQFSNSNQIFENKVSESLRQGMMIVFSNNNQLKGNQSENNGYNFGILNTKIEGYIQDIDTSNTINGKPIYYLVGQENKTIEAVDNPGYIGIINSKNIQIKNVSLLEPNYQQVLFINSQDSKIEESQIQNGVVAGIQILFSSNIEILKNKISNCNYAIYASTIIGAEGKTLENGLISENELTENGGGIGFINAFGNKILKNKISKNNPGIYFTNSSNNVISENTISENEYGAINLILSSDNTLKGNTILNNGEGILLSGSSNNIIFENSISKQNGQWGRGIYLSGIYTRDGLVKSENNKIYHNNFIQNKVNAKVESDYASGNFFDNGYQSGGNFWSDYQGKDENGDGIGDSPYCFQNGCDNYPFMAENGWQALSLLPKVLISEVYYDVAKDKGEDPDNEWVILHNLENDPVDISNWKIEDNYATDVLPQSSTIPANSFAIITASSTTFNFWKITKEMTKIVLDSKRIGNGLANDGDRVILKDKEGKIVDAMSYGKDKSIFDPPCPDVAEGKSLLRYPPDKDTDTKDDFIESEPTIGKNQPPIPIINFSPKNPVKGVKVKFDASSSTDPDGQILNFEWQIGTSTFSGTTTEFTFKENGEYQIILTATDNEGATSSASTIIKISPFSFAIITDLHIGRGYPDYDSSGFDDSGEGEDYYLTERLKNVVQWIIDNRDSIRCENTTCSIKFLAVLGDIADSGEKSEFLKAKKILDRLNEYGIPYVPLFGNHDVWPYTDFDEATTSLGENYFDENFWDENATNTKLMKEILGFKRDESNKNYKNFAFSFAGLNFIGLDFVERTGAPGKGVIPSAKVINETELWFTEHLHTNEPTITFAHHPFISDVLYAFDSFEMATLDETIKISKSKILAEFAGHVHSFEEFFGKWPENANIEYPAGAHWYTPANIPVVTTEAIMVGSNEKDSKGIIRVVKVLSASNLNYNNWENTLTDTEFVALNPQFEWYVSKIGPQNEPLEYTFVANYFTKKEISSFDWEFFNVLKKSGEKVIIPIDTLIWLPKIDTTKVKVPVKLTLTDSKTQKTEYIFRNEIIDLGRAFYLLLGPNNQAISLKTGLDLSLFPENRENITVQINEVHSEPKPVGLIKVNFNQATSNIDLTDLIAQSDLQKRKSILYLAKWPNEIGRLKALFIPSSGVGSIYLCPHATSLDEITPLCEDIEIINVGEIINGKNVILIEYGGQEYYLVFGIEGTGGGEFGPIEKTIKEINDYIQGLPSESFKNNSNQKKIALKNKLKEVFVKIENQEYQDAINKLRNDIRAKADGNIDGNPKNDWIIDFDAQKKIYGMIDNLINYLKGLF